MAANPTRGEVWLVDLGMVAKVRPCLVLSITADGENDRVLTTVIPHTTSTRESRFEVLSEVRFLKAGAFDAQNVVTIPPVKLIRRLGALPVDQMAAVEAAVKLWLGFKTNA
ncbi:MAG: type II toxin-antitoxin system PemK/MazF family toxin [Planctomycetota bacterium]